MQDEIIHPSRYMGVAQAAKYANCRQELIRAAVRSGELKAVDFGSGTERRHVKIKPEWVDEWALEHYRVEAVA